MSIEGKHAYRFGYLKSEAWSNVRLECLARDRGHCHICGEESISNDAHHIWYPENIYETTERHLVTLCRPCHEFCHSMLPECKTKDEESGMEQWTRFKNAVIAWRIGHLKMFSTIDRLRLSSPKELRDELERLKGLIESKESFDMESLSIKDLFDNIRKMAKIGRKRVFQEKQSALDNSKSDTTLPPSISEV